MVGEATWISVSTPPQQTKFAPEIEPPGHGRDGDHVTGSLDACFHELGMYSVKRTNSREFFPY
jgi:hypothetical protein